MKNAIELIGINLHETVRSVVKDLDDANMMKDAMFQCGYHVHMSVIEVDDNFDDWALKDAELITIDA